MYDNMTWSEGHVKHVGGKRPVVRKVNDLEVCLEEFARYCPSFVASSMTMLLCYYCVIFLLMYEYIR